MWRGDYQPTPKTAGEENILFWRVWTHPFNISKMGCFLKNLIVIPETPHTWNTPFNSNTQSRQSHYLWDSYRVLDGGKSDVYVDYFLVVGCESKV